MASLYRRTTFSPSGSPLPVCQRLLQYQYEQRQAATHQRNPLPCQCSEYHLHSG